MNIIIWMLWRFVFLNYKNCVEEHFLVPSALTLALYLIIKCIIMSTQWLRQVQLTKILHTIIIILTAFHSCALVSQFIFVNITRSTVFYFYFYLFAGSGSGGPSNEEFCAKDQEHTMCKYPVSFILKTGLAFEIYLIRAPRPSAPARLSSGSWAPPPRPPSWTSTTSWGGEWPRW